MITLLFGVFIVIMLVMIVLSNYYFKATTKIMARYDKTPLLVMLLFHSSYRDMFYIEHKNDLSPDELIIFERYCKVRVAIIIIFIAVVIIGNVLAYLNDY